MLNYAKTICLSPFFSFFFCVQSLYSFLLRYKYAIFGTLKKRNVYIASNHRKIHKNSPKTNLTFFCKCELTYVLRY